MRIVITSRFAESFVEKNERKYVRLGAYVLSVVLTSIAYAVFNLPWLNLLSTLVGLVLISLSYSGRMRKKILFVLYVLAVSCILDLSVYVILGNTFDFENYSESASILSLLFLFVVQLITSRVMKRNKNENLRPLHWGMYIVSLVVCIVASLVVIMDKAISPLSLSVVCGAFLTINLIIVYLFDDLIKTNQNEYENLILKDQALAYEKELLLQKKSSDEMRSFKHDIKYHLAQIKSLNQECKKEELDQYIASIENSLQEIVPISYTGNVGIDGVLNYMLQKAKNCGIDVDCRIVIPEELEVSVFDMNIILGNLIENAIEANENVDNPKIEFLMKYANGAVFVEISNTHSNRIKIVDGNIVSTKSSDVPHGYGLRNVKKVLAKYDHSILFEDKEGVFVVRILMKNKEKLGQSI